MTGHGPNGVRQASTPPSPQRTDKAPVPPMSADTLIALIVFAFTTSITPGPNNMMLLASGVNFGFRRTLPHMLGIGAGFLSLLVATGFGLGALLHSVPILYTTLKF